MKELRTSIERPRRRIGSKKMVFRNKNNIKA